MIALTLLDVYKWLSLPELALLVLTLIALMWYLWPACPPNRKIDLMVGVGVLLMLWEGIAGNTSWLALALYVVMGTLGLGTLWRVLRPINLPGRVWRAVRFLLCIAVTAVLLLLMTLAGELRYNPDSELGSLSYVEAFDALHARLALEYPLGKHKHIDWSGLKAIFRPAFAAAQQAHDPQRYYELLRAYVATFHDGHVGFVNDQSYSGNPMFRTKVGGGFGLSTVPLDDGRVLINLIVKGGLAEAQGMKLGAELITWAGQTASAVLRNTTWFDASVGTDAAHALSQGRFMVRAPIGTRVVVQFKNWGQTKVQSATLTARDDRFETLVKTRSQPTRVVLALPVVEGHLLRGRYGYLRVHHLISDREPDPESTIRRQLETFMAHHVRGVVLDVRDCPGGEDALAARLMGIFADHARLYEQVSYYSHTTRQFEFDRVGTLEVDPSPQRYSGPIVVLINSATASSCEGLPMVLKGQANVTVVGYTSTAASFAVVSAPLVFHLPEGHTLHFPDGRALDARGQIQLDADELHHGGVAPNVRIPRTQAILERQIVQGQDVELEAALELLDQAPR